MFEIMLANCKAEYIYFPINFYLRRLEESCDECLQHYSRDAANTRLSISRFPNFVEKIKPPGMSSTCNKS